VLLNPAPLKVHAAGQLRLHIAEMNLDLSDDEAAVLTRELADIVENATPSRIASAP
jgi:hypothetical protein